MLRLALQAPIPPAGAADNYSCPAPISEALSGPSRPLGPPPAISNVGKMWARSIEAQGALRAKTADNTGADSVRKPAMAVVPKLNATKKTPDNTGNPAKTGGLRHAVAVGFELVLSDSLTCADLQNGL